MASRTLRVELEGENGARLVFDQEREGFAAQIQRGMINIVTEKGSDVFNATKGTNLLRQAAAGSLSGTTRASNGAKFAALDTLFHLRTNDDADEQDRIAEVRMQVTSLAGRKAVFAVAFESVKGHLAGTASLEL